jgi:GNAT superfamily N-acetyltransferase
MNLVFRPARPEDKPRVLEITARTWDDGDYIPNVWDNWLADPQGELTVAVDEGTVVALSKLTHVVDDQWWIEGLRVDPERRLRGIGQAMTAYQVANAKRRGGRVLRYATGIRNEGSHQIAQRAGFHTLTRFVERVAEKLDEPPTAQVLTIADLDAGWDLAQGSDLFNAADGVYLLKWKASPLTRERLAEHLSQGMIMSVRQAGGDLAAWCIVDNDPAWEGVAVTSLFGTKDGIAKLARALRAQTSVWGKATVEVMTPPLPSALEALETAGYGLEANPKQNNEPHEHGIDIFELRLDESVTPQH